MLAPKSKQEKESKMHLKNLDRKICPSGHCLATHYENIPMQYTAIFHGCKNVNFQMKNSDIFLIFAQNIDFGYTLGTRVPTIYVLEQK